jgi:hypothetical protein
VQFGFEGWWITDYPVTDKLYIYYIEAIEDSELLLLLLQPELMIQLPAFEQSKTVTKRLHCVASELIRL